MTTLKDELAAAPLGHATTYPDTYDATLLFALPRAPQRAELGIGADVPFTGADVWTAYEHTWLDLAGKPAVAMLSFAVPATSPAIVESKSMKLYLGSFAQSRFAEGGDVVARIERDLFAATQMPVAVTLTPQRAFRAQRLAELAGESIDRIEVGIDRYEVEPAFLHAGHDEVRETLRTDLFRSVCPVTGQPDYASLAITYAGPRIDRAGLLRYVISYRLHAGFHEHCVERMFTDLIARCGCRELSIEARFTRRGGLDINPFRTNAGVATPDNVRTPRQ